MSFFATVLKVTAVVAVPLATGLAARFINGRMDVRLARERQEHVEELALSAVLFSAQRFKNAPPGEETNELKRDAAANHLIRIARAAHIKLDQEAADYEIEVALFRMTGRWPEDLGTAGEDVLAQVKADIQAEKAKIKATAAGDSPNVRAIS